ncbi:MAG: hypothetical protein J0I31_19270 [Rhizobiales bacterium]|nr:hypothetical protein [Hyphomicrobiales bacterium]
MGERYLVSADTKEMPGKVKLVFVRFETEVVSAGPAFDNRVFTLLDPRLPEARILASILAPRAPRR